MFINHQCEDQKPVRTLPSSKLIVLKARQIIPPTHLTILSKILPPFHSKPISFSNNVPYIAIQSFIYQTNIKLLLHINYSYLLILTMSEITNMVQI